ncbi:uncharacterized protein MONBRDRAFT_28266 [Monosiga brevicollis MX1]|uniref:Phosphatidic acid phosphatase type 2/haloperoxidase domain-containing protein n=1 Tax=Monosiga brevicollis TaxID=81824 RepID=A9V7N6_MONBE|nr:uncharacterized protein MONBRDRAFT_28266 [Monosiga brevicollis MX1]EDQ86408.1 predicted protein [Monosiga brevicollis MX1]|eukprot:XP_001748798.1 hypothetical protein [Monosiga brevicollis MX1]
MPEPNRLSLLATLLRETSWPSLLVALLALVFCHFVMAVQKQNWPVTNVTIGEYPFLKAERERVPSWAFVLYGFLLGPYVALIEMFVVRHGPRRLRIVMATNALLICWEGFLWTLAVTEMAKHWVAEPRPDYEHRCLGVGGTISLDNDGNVVCLYGIGDGNMSFPSGHSSGSLFGGIFASGYCLWVAFFRRADTYFRTHHGRWKSYAAARYTELLFILCMWPLFFSSYVAISRIVDHRHSPADVTAGSLIGIVLGTIFLARLLARSSTHLPVIHGFHKSDAMTSPLVDDSMAVSMDGFDDDISDGGL